MLLQSCSSSSMERLFSTMGNIATKRRNCLSIEKTDGLDFLATNMHMTKLSFICDDANENFICILKEESIPPIVDKDNGNGIVKL